MNDGINKKEIKNYSRDFRTIASRTLNSNFDAFDSNLKRLIYHIDNNPIIMEYINSCDDKSYEFSIEDDVKDVSNGYGRYIFENYIEEEKEVIYIYKILKFIVENNIKCRGYIIPYSSSNKYQEKLDGFCDNVILPFVNSINGNFERICVEMGFDENKKFDITINGGQVILANDNSSVTAIQNNVNDNIDELIKIIKENLKQSNIDNSIKQEIIENAEGIQEELKQKNPRKGILKVLGEGLKESIKKVPDVMEFGANVAALIQFLAPFLGN